MFVVETTALAVAMCVITMLCWGSWANTQKLATKEWRFQLFYWDYSIGVLLLALIFAFTLGSMGEKGRSFLVDLREASFANLGSAFLGGVLFNLANILLVAAIDIAGMAVAFPVGIGLALVIGVIDNYAKNPGKSMPALLFLGVALVAAAIVLNAIAYRRLPAQGQKTIGKGLVISVIAGVLMGFFYGFVAKSMGDSQVEGKLVHGLTPYTAVVLFSCGLLASSFLWNSLVMVRPFVGDPVPFADYFRKGNPRLHLVGILGGMIWNVGMSFNIIASTVADPAVSYGLGQGATMVAAFWGVFIWKEFKPAPKGTGKLIALMFATFIVGLGLIVLARVLVPAGGPAAAGAGA
jgi:glucose uptake protein